MSFPFSFWKFTPLVLKPSIWWVADNVDGAGNAVDMSGNGNNGIQTAVTITNNAAQGHPAFTFNGTTSKFELTNTFNTGTNFSIFVFLKAAADLTNVQTFSGGGTNRQYLAINTLDMLVFFDGTSPVSQSNAIVDSVAFIAIGFVCNAGTGAFYRNGVVVPLAAGAGAAVGSVVTSFGYVLTVFTAFQCLEVVWVPRAMTASEISALTEYWRVKSPF